MLGALAAIAEQFPPRDRRWRRHEL